MSNPFASTAAKPGEGLIHLACLPPNTPRLRTVRYQYPLKLISPAPNQTATDSETETAPTDSSGGISTTVHAVYILTYGGGLVAGDQIHLHVRLERATRLVLLTQGSTKLFKSPSREIISRQRMTVDLAASSALCFLPDPVQPFEDSCFEQRQIYNLHLPPTESSTGGATSTGNLCVLDWVSNGRSANGENWSFRHYASRNEVYLCLSPDDVEKKRLLLRDNIVLDAGGHALRPLADLMDGQAVFGTLIVCGPMFAGLAAFFMREFDATPRIGGRKWDTVGEEVVEKDVDLVVARRLERQRQVEVDRVIWSAASVRGIVVVKFAAREVEGARRWLRSMLVEDGSVEKRFGERALLCLR